MLILYSIIALAYYLFYFIIIFIFFMHLFCLISYTQDIAVSSFYVQKYLGINVFN